VSAVKYSFPVLVNCVVDACVKKVVEARTMVSLSHSGVVVDWLATELYVEGVRIHGAESETDEPSATEPPPVKPEPAVTVRAPLPVRSELPIVEVETTLPF
jgi:hypothetical protein